MVNQTLLNRVTMNSQVLTGKPTIRGMRISVEQILKFLSAGNSANELLAELPDLEPDDIKVALLYAALTKTN